MTGSRGNDKQARTPSESADRTLEDWRWRATNVYSLVVALAHLPVIASLAIRDTVGEPIRELMLVAWGLVAMAALLRRASVRSRVWLIVASVWMYALCMLFRTGVFGAFRLALLGTPFAVILLAGVRHGLFVGTVNTVFVVAALRATEAGWLPAGPPPWTEGEWFTQTLPLIGTVVPQLLMLAWFSHTLSTSIRRESVTAGFLRAEAEERGRLEVELLEANEQEGRRIGSELHDGVCQDLTGLLLRSKRVEKFLDARGDSEATAISDVVQGLGEAIGEIHGLSRRLSPGRLTGGDLAGAIEDLVKRTSETSEAVVVFSRDGSGPGPGPQVAQQLFRIAQEALANAVRHARASRIEVCLIQSLSRTVLRVDDDGVGLSSDARDRGGLGLNSMRWRATKIGGCLTVNSLPGGGTRVEGQVLRDSDGEEERVHGS